MPCWKPAIRSSNRRVSPSALGMRGDDLADVVVELDQIHENRPQDVQEQVLLVFLQLGMEPVDHLLSRRLRADLPLEERLEAVELPLDGVFANARPRAARPSTASDPPSPACGSWPE